MLLAVRETVCYLQSKKTVCYLQSENPRVTCSLRTVVLLATPVLLQGKVPNWNSRKTANVQETKLEIHPRDDLPSNESCRAAVTGTVGASHEIDYAVAGRGY